MPVFIVSKHVAALDEYEIDYPDLPRLTATNDTFWTEKEATEFYKTEEMYLDEFLKENMPSKNGDFSATIELTVGEGAEIKELDSYTILTD